MLKFLEPSADKNRQLELNAKRDIVVPILNDVIIQVILRSSKAMTSSRSFRVEKHCFVFMVEIKMQKKSNTAQMPYL
jgi:hypothetical protein